MMHGLANLKSVTACPLHCVYLYLHHKIVHFHDFFFF